MTFEVLAKVSHPFWEAFFFGGDLLEEHGSPENDGWSMLNLGDVRGIFVDLNSWLYISHRFFGGVKGMRNQVLLSRGGGPEVWVKPKVSEF